MEYEMIDAILIDPFDHSVSKVYVKNELQSMYKVMQCSLIEVVYLPSNQLLIIDEEGRLKSNNRWFTIGDNSYAGRCLLVDDSPDGEFVSTTTDIDDIANTLYFEEEGFHEEPFMKFIPIN
jgi:hypothetical protein